MKDINSQVVAGIDDVLILADGAGKVLFANESASRLFGRDLAGTCLRPEEVDDDPPIAASVVRGYRAALTASGPHSELLSAATAEGPRYYWLGVSAGRNDEPCRLVRIADITDSLSGSPSLQRVFSVVNHDIRSPLTSISGAAELLGSGRVGSLDGVQQRLLAIIEEGVRKIDEILARTKRGLAAGQLAAVAGEGREQR